MTQDERNYFETQSKESQQDCHYFIENNAAMINQLKEKIHKIKFPFLDN
jgi:hypothetical protein